MSVFGNHFKVKTVQPEQKRALSRAILKLAGLYKEGVYGEDELEKSQQ